MNIVTYNMCVTIDGVWMNKCIDHLQVVTLQFTKAHSLVSVTRSFLVTAPTMAIPLPPAQVLFSHTPVQS
jgi:hypothetical protein